MKLSRGLILFMALATACVCVHAIDNGLALLPPMGWSTWCTDDLCGLFDWCFEHEIHGIADAMASNGMKELGYEYILLDDCWAAHTRDANGNLQPDADRFPSGIPALVGYVHNKGLKLGLYTCAGNLTCKYDRPGSWGHFQQDANQYAAWGVDQMKVDWCHHPSLSPDVVYAEMRDALNATGKPILFSICEWGEDSPWVWGRQTGNAYRIHKDHLPFWGGEQGVANIIESAAGKSEYAGPGGWNDLDFLMTLFPLTMNYQDSKTEFAMWALVASPMFVTTDVRDMSDEKKSILLNAEIIAISQDPLAIPGDRLFNNSQDGTQVWGKPLHDGSWGIVLYNPSDDHSYDVELDFTLLGLSSNTLVDVRDLWAHKDLGQFSGGFKATVPPHGGETYRVTVVASKL